MIKRITVILLAVVVMICGCSSTDKNIEDGNYEIEATLSGGTGRAGIVSPLQITVKNGEIIANIQWSSPYYDYMVVGEEKYFPTNTDGDSTFEIPVEDLEEPLEIIADTTAMSEPHEIEYILEFSIESLSKK